jgi:hypothetical protein
MTFGVVGARGASTKTGGIHRQQKKIVIGGIGKQPVDKKSC